MNTNLEEFIEAVLSGRGDFSPVSREVYARRMTICRECIGKVGHCPVEADRPIELCNLWPYFHCEGKFPKGVAAIEVTPHPPPRVVPPPPLPSIPQQIKSFTTDAANSIAVLLRTGKLRRTPEEQERLHAICKSNRCGMYRVSDDRCAHPKCGCHMALKAGAIALHCAAGLW